MDAAGDAAGASDLGLVRIKSLLLRKAGLDTARFEGGAGGAGGAGVAGGAGGAGEAPCYTLCLPSTGVPSDAMQFVLLVRSLTKPELSSFLRDTPGAAFLTDPHLAAPLDPLDPLAQGSGGGGATCTSPLPEAADAAAVSGVAVCANDVEVDLVEGEAGYRPSRSTGQSRWEAYLRTMPDAMRAIAEGLRELCHEELATHFLSVPAEETTGDASTPRAPNVAAANSAGSVACDGAPEGGRGETKGSDGDEALEAGAVGPDGQDGAGGGASSSGRGGGGWAR